MVNLWYFRGWGPDNMLGQQVAVSQDRDRVPSAGDIVKVKHGGRLRPFKVTRIGQMDVETHEVWIRPWGWCDE